MVAEKQGPRVGLLAERERVLVDGVGERGGATMRRAHFGMLLLLAALGCAHGTISPVDPRLAAPSGKVAAVAVSLDPGVSDDRRAVYARLHGDDLIAQEIVQRLGRDGLYDAAGAMRVDVRVSVFRLRSTANAFWNGWLAGIDLLEGRVDVSRASAEPARYTFKLSASEEAYFKYSAAARFKSLARVLATRVSELFREPHREAADG
jgi:hypothetical protein